MHTLFGEQGTALTHHCRLQGHPWLPRLLNRLEHELLLLALLLLLLLLLTGLGLDVWDGRLVVRELRAVLQGAAQRHCAVHCEARSCRGVY